MDSENPEADAIVQENEEYTPRERHTHHRAHHTQQPQGNVEQEVIKIADIQRMNSDQLSQFGKKYGLKHLASLTKSQAVFEIVKVISENPNEVLYGEGVLEVLPDGFGFLRSTNYNYL